MAWPYDQDGNIGYQSPQLSGMSSGNYGISPLAFNQASGPQNVASLYGATSFGSDVGNSTTAGMQPAGGGMFASLSDLFSKNSIFGGTDEKGVTTTGWAPLALGAGQAILGGIQGLQAQKLAQSQFKEGVRQFDLNYGAQRQSLNTQLEDRQRARVASNPGAYESVSSYLDKNRIK